MNITRRTSVRPSTHTPEHSRLLPARIGRNGIPLNQMLPGLDGSREGWWQPASAPVAPEHPHRAETCTFRGRIHQPSRPPRFLEFEAESSAELFCVGAQQNCFKIVADGANGSLVFPTPTEGYQNNPPLPPKVPASALAQWRSGAVAQVTGPP